MHGGNHNDSKHMWLMVLCCAVPIIILLVAFFT